MRTENRRLLAVHAHPDDEVLTTGGSMARHVAEGGDVTLVTCTLGEEGEILVPEIAHLGADGADRLGEHRMGELDAAMEALGITDNRILGGPGHFRDSGMMGLPSNDRIECFWQADLREAADLLVPVLRHTRPHVLVTYDDFGGYGHPDHIQAHRVAMYALVLAAVPSYRPDFGEPWDVPKVYWTAMPVSAVRSGILALRERGETTGFAAMDPDDIPFATPDSVVTTEVDVTDFQDRKIAAMRAHASQINLEEGFFALSNNLGLPIFGTEYFRLVRGELGPPGANGRETSLFA